MPGSLQDLIRRATTNPDFVLMTPKSFPTKPCRSVNCSQVSKGTRGRASHPESPAVRRRSGEVRHVFFNSYQHPEAKQNSRSNNKHCAQTLSHVAMSSLLICTSRKTHECPSISVAGVNPQKPASVLLGHADRCACVTPVSHSSPVTVFHQSALSSQLPALLPTPTQSSPDSSCGGCCMGDSTSRFPEQEKTSVQVHV